MKGQSVNIDFTVGLTLFTLAAVSTLIITVNSTALELESSLQHEASQIDQRIEENFYAEAGKTPLILKNQSGVDRIPVDRSYMFPENAYPGSAGMKIPSEINITENRVVTVVDGENTSYSMTYFYSNVSNLSYSNDLEVGANISNSMINVSPGSNGLESLKIHGNELIRKAELDETNFDTEEETLYASTFSSDLKIYNGSPEIIYEQGNGTFYLKNFTRIYWPGNGTENLEISDSYSGKVDGFAAATVDGEDYGIAFMGENLSAHLEKDSENVNVSINSSRLRIRAFNSSVAEGRKRVKSYSGGEIFFGAAEKNKALNTLELEKFSNTSLEGLRKILETGGFKFQLTIEGKRDRKQVETVKDWNNGSFNNTSPERDEMSGNLGLGYRNGSKSDSLVGFWRMDGTSGTDYSGSGNTGSLESSVTSGKEGVFGTNAYNFSGDGSSMNMPSSRSLNITSNITISFWANADSLTGTFQDAVKKSGSNGREYWIYFPPDGDQIRWSTSYENCDCNFEERGANIPQVNDSKWHQYAIRQKMFTGDGNHEISFYRDGQHLTTKTVPSSYGLRNGTTGEVNIGDINGRMDEVKIYNRSLTEEEVKKLYLNGVHGDFRGDYEESEKMSEKKSWKALKANVSTPSETSVNASFYSIDSGGSVLGRQFIDLQENRSYYTLHTPNSQKYRIRFEGTSNDVENTWTVNNYSLSYSRVVSRGTEVPEQDAVSIVEPGTFIERNGETVTADRQTVVWQ